MTRPFGILIVTALVTLGLTSAARAGRMIITPTSATAGPTTYAGSGTQLINGSGLASSVPSGYDTLADLPKHNEYVQNMWEANGTNTGYVIFDLGSIKTIDAIVVWNDGEEAHANTAPFDLSGRSVKNLGIYTNTSPIADPTNPTGSGAMLLSSPTQFSQATNATLPSNNTIIPGLDWNLDYNLVPVEYALASPISTRYIEFNILSSWTGAGYVGLSEVRFAVVPEPATLSLAGLAGGAMLLRRRRAALRSA